MLPVPVAILIETAQRHGPIGLFKTLGVGDQVGVTP